MNRRELARNGVLGLCGLVATKLAPEAIAKEPIVFKPDEASAMWTVGTGGVWEMNTPDGVRWLTVDTRPNDDTMWKLGPEIQVVSPKK